MSFSVSDAHATGKDKSIINIYTFTFPFSRSKTSLFCAVPKSMRPYNKNKC